MQVLVDRKTEYTKGGVARLKAAKPIVQNVACMYADGTIRTTTGDVWKVKPYNHKGIDFRVAEAPE